VTPLHKFTGAKNWLAEPEHAHRLPNLRRASVYREPFFGGGAFFWRNVATLADAMPPRIVLGDMNAWICDLLVALRDYPEELLEQIATMPYSEEVFERAKRELNAWRANRMTEMSPSWTVWRAANFLAIVRYGFNGLFRENKSGEINTSFGRPAAGGSAPGMPSREVVRLASKLLARAEIRQGDFADVLHDVEPGEVIYLDPPYDDTFTGYTAAGFTSGTSSKKKKSAEQSALFDAGDMLPTKSDLARLRKACDEIHRRGSLFLLSNKDTPTVRAMFAGYAVERVMVRHNNSCDPATRGDVGEVLVRNYGAAFELVRAYA